MLQIREELGEYKEGNVPVTPVGGVRGGVVAAAVAVAAAVVVAVAAAAVLSQQSAGTGTCSSSGKSLVSIKKAMSL